MTSQRSTRRCGRGGQLGFRSAVANALPFALLSGPSRHGPHPKDDRENRHRGACWSVAVHSQEVEGAEDGHANHQPQRDQWPDPYWSPGELVQPPLVLITRRLGLPFLIHVMSLAFDGTTHLRSSRRSRFLRHQQLGALAWGRQPDFEEHQRIEATFGAIRLERYVTPFYLDLMAFGASSADGELTAKVRNQSQTLSSGDVAQLLQMHWRARVMGAWYAIAVQDATLSTAVHNSLETSLGHLSSPALIAGSLTYPNEGTAALLLDYIESDLQNQWGVAGFAAAALSRLTPTQAAPAFAFEPEDLELVDQLMAFGRALQSSPQPDGRATSARGIWRGTWVSSRVNRAGRHTRLLRVGTPTQEETMNRKTIRRSAAALALGLAAATAPAAIGATTASAAPYCGITWGSLAKTNATMNVTSVAGLRAGRHDCYDRLVIDQKGKATGYDVRYVSVVTQDGSGNPVPVAGGAALQVITRAARNTTAPAMPNVTGLHDLPSGQVGRLIRGPVDDRPRRAGTAAVPGAQLQRHRDRHQPPRHRRRPPVVSSPLPQLIALQRHPECRYRPLGVAAAQ